jgi:hypothetical protein
MPLIWRNRIE